MELVMDDRERHLSLIFTGLQDLLAGSVYVYT